MVDKIDKEDEIEWKIRAIKRLIEDELERDNTKWMAVASLAGEAHRIMKRKEESK